MPFEPLLATFSVTAFLKYEQTMQILRRFPSLLASISSVKVTFGTRNTCNLNNEGNWRRHQSVCNLYDSHKPKLPFSLYRMTIPHMIHQICKVVRTTTVDWNVCHAKRLKQTKTGWLRGLSWIFRLSALVGLSVSAAALPWATTWMCDFLLSIQMQSPQHNLFNSYCLKERKTFGFCLAHVRVKWLIKS